MEFLKTTAPGTTKTVVEVYREKQLAWAKERSAWDKAKIETAGDYFHSSVGRSSTADMS